MTSIDRTAYPRFKRMITSRELADCFSPSGDEIAWARETTVSDPHLLALTVWLKSYQRLGYFPRLDEVPQVIVEHVRDALCLPAHVAAEVDAPRTAKRHREAVRARLGVKYDAAQVRATAEDAIRTAAQTKDNPADLINVALDVLVKQGCELPGYTTLDEATKTIRTRVNRGFFTAVAARIGPGHRAGLERLMVVDPATRRSGFDDLKAPAKSATLGKFKQRLEHMLHLDELGPTEEWLRGVPPGKIGHFAGEARVTDVSDLAKMRDDAKRLTLLASLVHVLRTAARDEVTDMFCKRMAVIHRKGRDRLEELREEHRAESERLLEVFGEVLAAARQACDPETVADEPGSAPAHATPQEPGAPMPSMSAAGEDMATRAGQLVLRALESGGGLEQLAAAHQAVAAFHGNNYLPLLERFYRSHRTALFTLVDALTLVPTTADRGVLDALEFVRATRHRRGEWIEQDYVVTRDGRQVRVSIDIDAFASSMWKRTLRDRQRPGMLARRHLEVCVFSHLAAELRSGDVAVAGSDSYADLHAQMMTWDECEGQVAGFCDQAGLPADPAALVAFYKAKLAETAAAVDAGYPANTDLRLEGGRPVLARRRGADRRPAAIALEGAILGRLPERSLLDILARSAHLTGWHRHFGPASGSDPKIRDTLGRYVVTAFAYGGNLGPTEVARHMRGISAHEIYTAGNKHADGGRIHSASADIVNAFAALDVVRMWGDGQAAATDGPADRHLGEQPAGGDLDPVRRLRRDRLQAHIRHLCRPVLALHPLRGVGGGVHPGLAAGQHLRPAARPDPCRYPRPCCCRCSGSRRCWASSCCPGSATGTT